MPTPSARTPVKIARGSYSNLNSSLSDLKEGEIMFAEDQDKAYVKEGSELIGLNNNFVGQLKEAVTITAGKLSDNTNIDLSNGNVFYFSTAESTTSTPNIRYNSSTTLNTKMSTGQAVSVTIITTANTSGYSAQLTIDGSAVTEYWVGGSAPSSGGSSGVDILTYTITKTGNATWLVIASHTLTSS